MAGSMAEEVFSITSLESLNEDVKVPWENTKRREVDMTMPKSIRRQNLIINRT
ncbi:hypothetical protein PITCH_A1190023 [uncultured Desulfobacterium sp.]|uniref:Uncharacterized protein n=1 Tax=uncultured Desulfobacterium sp. TaxID=201089 RepID=A0A445MRQ0_9BACT|nr:hypothetical protein PITCH_A1190023 [uncultured Desulfobacterium sp.]